MRLSGVAFLFSVFCILFLDIVVVTNPTIAIVQGFLDSLWSSIFNQEKQKCFEELGCIEYTPEWYNQFIRPLNRLPEDRSQVNTNFLFFNPKLFHEPTRIINNPGKKKNLLDQGFNPMKLTKFIVHGYLDQGRSFWLKKLANALLKAGDFNIFVVDWDVGSHTLYTQATANTLVVGLETAHYIKCLQNEFPQMSLNQFHFIGHSLGSHICGYAGEKLGGKLGRITGLDPAGPLFQNMPIKVRLDPTDAKFVDVIRSDGRTDLSLGGQIKALLFQSFSSFGMAQACGHLDFYPNNGELQPGCEVDKIPDYVFRSKSLDEANRQIFACNRHRAIFYFIEAMNTPTTSFVGHECQNYKDYKAGLCGSCKSDGNGKCTRMGLEAAKYPIGKRSLVKLYLSTAAEYPFSLRHYLANIRLSFLQGISNSQYLGKLNIILKGSKHFSSSNNVIESKDGDRNINFVIESPQGLGPIKNIKLEWKCGADEIFGEYWYKTTCFWSGCNYRMYVERIQVTDMDGMGKNKYGSSMLCGGERSDYTESKSGSSALFSRNCQV